MDSWKVERARSRSTQDCIEERMSAWAGACAAMRPVRKHWGLGRGGAGFGDVVACIGRKQTCADGASLPFILSILMPGMKGQT